MIRSAARSASVTGDPSALPSTRRERLELARSDSKLSGTRSGHRGYRASACHAKDAAGLLETISPLQIPIPAGLNAFRLARHLRIVRRVGQVAETAFLVSIRHRQQCIDGLRHRIQAGHRIATLGDQRARAHAHEEDEQPWVLLVIAIVSAATAFAASVALPATGDDTLFVSPIAAATSARA